MASLGGDKVLLFGGNHSLTDTWVYDLSDNNWTWKGPATTPSARYDHGMASIGDDKVLLFGGYDVNLHQYDDETWVYDLSDNSWTLKTPPVKPSARTGHAMVSLGGDKVLLFGGHEGGSSYSNETWVYDLSDNTWTLKTPSDKPESRAATAMASLGGDRALLFGGANASLILADTWVYDLSDNSWTEKSLVTKPSARGAHGMATLAGDRVLLFGGGDGVGYNDESWVYDLDVDTWTLKSPATKPSARNGHAMASPGSDQVLLFGGRDAVTHPDDTWLYTSSTFYADNDLDGYGDPNNSVDAPSAPPGYVVDNTDCDDTNPNVNPGATDVYYVDADGDGYQDENSATTYSSCDVPAGYALQSESPFDCDDTNPNIYPGADEILNNGIDENCNGSDDDDGCFSGTYYYQDVDGDGFQSESSGVVYNDCNPPAGYAIRNENAFDCKDDNNAIYPGAVEVCDGVDNNCDGVVDGDSDFDGYSVCDECNDGDGSVHPGATEVCDGIDNNCDGNVDEGVKTTFYRDADGDGFGNPGLTIQDCAAPDGYVSNNSDCDDTKRLYQDGDGDGYGAGAPVACGVANNADCNDGNQAVHPGAAEINNGIDDNCNGQTDEPTCVDRVINVNLYGNNDPYVNSQWNNWNAATTLSFNNFKYSDGTSSVVDAVLSAQSAVVDNGPTYPVTMCPQKVGRYTSYSSGNPRTLRLSSLDNSKKYKIEIYASRNSNPGNTTRFTINGVNVNIVTYQNYTNVAVFNNISPAGGNIVVTIAKVNAYDYINGFKITEKPGSSCPVNCVVSDWGPWSACSKSCGGGTQTRTRTVLVPAKNGGTPCPALTETRSCNANACPPSSNKVINANLYGNNDPYVNSQWNNWNLSTTLSFSNFKYSDGTSSIIDGVLSGQSGIGDNGNGYPVTMCPQQVGRYTSYNSGGPRTLTLSSLDNSKYYKIELFASRGTNPGNTTRFTINGVNVNIATYQNYSNVAVFDNISPSSNRIIVTIAKLNAYDYINGFRITEKTSIGTSSPITQIADEQDAGGANLQVTVMPNPSPSYFNIRIRSNEESPVTVRVLDIYGRVLSVHEKIGVHSTLRLGGTWVSGTYFAEVKQGTRRRILKLVKPE